MGLRDYFLVLFAMFQITFLSSRLTNTVIIAKYMALTPVGVVKVVTLGEDTEEAEMVTDTDADKAEVTGGAASQPSLTPTHVLMSPRTFILTLSTGILWQRRRIRCVKNRRETSTGAVRQ